MSKTIDLLCRCDTQKHVHAEEALKGSVFTSSKSACSFQEAEGDLYTFECKALIAGELHQVPLFSFSHFLFHVFATQVSSTGKSHIL